MESNEGRFQQVAPDVLSGIRRALGSVAEHLGTTHGVTHEEQRDRRRDQSRYERGDVGENERGGAGKAFLAILVDGASPTSLVKGMHLDALGCESWEEDSIRIAYGLLSL